MFSNKEKMNASSFLLFAFWMSFLCVVQARQTQSNNGFPEFLNNDPTFDRSNAINEFWDNPKNFKKLHSDIQVQAVLAEGAGWEGSSKETSVHVVIRVSGKEPIAHTTVPYADRPIRLQADLPMSCIIEQGQGDFTDCSAKAHEIQTFKTNALGRISFSIPLDSQLKKCQEQSKYRLPTLLIQTAYMSEDEW